jgi:ribosomal protein S6--L-glutamate ligase
MSHPGALNRVIALEGRLKKCSTVLTLGVRPNFFDYDEQERALIRSAPRIYYPSCLYAELFHLIGKTTFPSYHSYRLAQDKIRQTALFQMAGIPHPRTRVFYGKKQKQTILSHFDLPLIAKQPRGSAMGRGVWLIHSADELDDYCQNHAPAYIQEYLRIDRDMRIVVIGRKVRLAYWRIGPPGQFRNNVSAGGRIDFAPLPKEALDLALHTAEKCCWDDVGIDVCSHNGVFYVLEGNMKYGLAGFAQAGVVYHELMADLIARKEI